MNLDHECGVPFRRPLGPARPGCSACKLERRVRWYRWNLVNVALTTTVLFLFAIDLLGLPFLWGAWLISILPGVCGVSYLHWRRP